MKTFLIMLLFAGVVQAEPVTVRVDGQDMEINPATGMLIKATPPQLKHIQPSTEFRTSGDVVSVSGTYSTRASSSLPSTVITSNGIYTISRSGSTTFVMGGRR